MTHSPSAVTSLLPYISPECTRAGKQKEQTCSQWSPCGGASIALVGLRYLKPAIAHRVSAFRNVQPELPFLRGPAGVGRGKMSIRVNYTDLCQTTLMCDFWFLVHLTVTFSFLISAFCRQNCFLQKQHENASTWCILVIIVTMTVIKDLMCSW